MRTVLHPAVLTLTFLAVAMASYHGLQLVSGPRLVGTMARRRRRSVTPAEVPSLWFRLFFPLLDLLAPLFKRVPWESYRRRMPLALRRAGIADGITVDHLLAMKAVCAVVVPFLGSRLFLVFTNPALFVALGIAAFFLPDRLVADLRRAREHRIVRALPGAVDVLSLSVEAGLEFLLAIQRLVERGAVGPLRDELATILSDIRLGLSRAEAMKAFAARVEIPEVASFVSVLVQADMLGASIGPVLKSQAERMRVERFQRAERAGAKASQKILFPLVLFIFPAVLVVIIGPVALRFIYGN
jgi:tight adherence protein C